MTIDTMKTCIAASWIAVVVAVGLLAGATSTKSLVALACVAALPSLAMMLLWHEPTRTMTETIRDGRE
jgi:hypothetical protein